MNRSIIVIPIYKSNPDKYEQISFNQCCEVLKNYPICIITYKQLDISYYLNELKKRSIVIKLEFFDKCYFESINGYNNLMLSEEFYFRFTNFEYMLIYQLDAYVFRDELEYWCNQGFDYIGAPWIFKDYKRRHILKTILFKIVQLFLQFFYRGYRSIDMQERAGNGGFSLRKISTIIEILKKYKDSKILNLYKSDNYLTEDLFYSFEINRYYKQIRIPKKEIAMKFSVETEPIICFKLNNNCLPFGCHAWYKNDWFLNNFWSKYIFYNKK